MQLTVLNVFQKSMDDGSYGEALRDWRGKASTPQQNAVLFEFGLLPYHPITRGEAARLISRIRRGSRKCVVSK